MDRSRLSEDTRICYCTTGVLLQKLIGPQQDDNFNKYTHIILDEVHERDLDTDFVMLIIKLRSYGLLNARIILMSATIDKEKFQKYFTLPLNANLKIKASSGHIYPPAIEIRSKLFNVAEYYWDDLISNSSFLSPVLSKLLREKSDKYSNKEDMFSRRRTPFTNFETPRTIKHQMQNLNFKKDEPCMTDESMVMVIALLR